MEPLYARLPGAGNVLRPVLLLGMDPASLARFGRIEPHPTLVWPGLKRAAVPALDLRGIKRPRVESSSPVVSSVSAPSVFERSYSSSTVPSSDDDRGSGRTEDGKAPEPRADEPALRDALERLRSADGEPGDEARRIARRAMDWRPQASPIDRLMSRRPVELPSHVDFLEAERIALCALLSSTDLEVLRDRVFNPLSRDAHEACAKELFRSPPFPALLSAQDRRLGADKLADAGRLGPAFAILRDQAEHGRSNPSRPYSLYPHTVQLAAMLDDSPALRTITEAVDTVCQRGRVLGRLWTRAFERAKDRASQLSDATRALLLIAARSERDRFDVVIVVVAMLRGRRGLSDAYDAHIDQTLARLAPSLGHAYGRREACPVPPRSCNLPPPVDLSTAAGRVVSVVELPEWAFEAPAPTRPIERTEITPALPPSSDGHKWAYTVMTVGGADKFVGRGPATSLDARSIVTQLNRIGRLDPTWDLPRIAFSADLQLFRTAPKSRKLPALPLLLPPVGEPRNDRASCEIEALRRIYNQPNLTNAHARWLWIDSRCDSQFLVYLQAASRVVALQRILEGGGARQSLWAQLEARLRRTDRFEQHAVAVHCLADPRMRTAERMPEKASR